MTTYDVNHGPPVLSQRSQPSFRGGHVARMAGMPVASLRIWEQRYQAVRPTTAASGHRMYRAADIERVTLLPPLRYCLSLLTVKPWSR